MNAPAVPNRIALEWYSKALANLQTALEDPVLCRHPDVLCATEIMNLFELLDLGSDMSYASHTAGVATMIEFRGPQSYQSDFEKSLFFAQCGPIYTEAVHSNTSSFLEKPAWQATLQSIIAERSSEIPYAKAYVSIWACMGAMPGVLRSVRSVVRNVDGTPDTVRATLLSRIYELRAGMMEVGTKYSLTSTRRYGTETYSSILSDEAGGTKRFEILGALATHLMGLARCAAAIDSSVAQPMEAHAQQLAMQIVDLKRETSKAHPRAALFLVCKALAARAVLLTASDWSDDISSRMPDSVVAEPVFERWMDLWSPQRVTDEWRNEYGEI
ncbi:MAG: hypothetical protein Q9168_002471 [Polycauliona sp. 1 TL-2023]